MENKNDTSPLKVFFEIVEKIELALGGLCLAILFVVILIGVASRNPWFKFNAAWYEETTRVFFLWMMWIGVGAGFNHSESSRVTVLVNALPEVCQKICHVLYYVFSLIMFGIIIWFGFRAALQQARMNEMGSALRIPMWIVGVAVPVGGIFGFLGTLNTLLFENWRLKTTAEQLEADEIAAQTKALIEAENAAIAAEEAAKKAGGGKA